MIEKFIVSPQFRLTPTILNSIGAIERAQGLIDGAPLVPTYERELQEQALVSTIHASTHIEGNTLSSKVIQRLLAGEEVSARQREVQEIINYRKVIEYLDKVHKDRRRPFSDVMVREFHKVLMRDILPDSEIGEYRTTQNYIINANSGDRIYTPPPPKKVAQLMLKMADWINRADKSKYHPIIKAALTHYMVEDIHPFVDGNGRTGRVTAMFLLYRDGYDTKRLFSLEEYYDRDAGAYYKALESVAKQKGDATKWIEYFTLGFAEQIEVVAQRIKSYLQAEIERGRFAKLELNERQYKAIRLLQRTLTITASEYADHFGVSKRTANYDLAELAEKGLVVLEGESRSSRFKLL